MLSEKRGCYTQNEMRLFEALQMQDLAPFLLPTVMYRSAVQKAFFERLEGPHVEALRRAANAVLNDGQPYRNSKEFDDLVKF